MRSGLRKFLIVGHYHSSNRGDAAILDGLVGLLREGWPEARIGVLAAHPGSVEEMHGLPAAVDAVTSRRFNGAYLAWRRLWLHRRAAALRGRTPAEFPAGARDPRRSLEAFAWADAVVGAGGSYLHDIYRKPLIGYWLQFELGRLLGKPVWLVGQSLGPYRSRFSRRLARRQLGAVDLLTVREPASLRVLDALGLPADAARCTADTAFALRPADPGRGRDLLAKEGVRFPGPPLLTVSVRHWRFYRGDAKEGHARYMRAVGAALRAFASTRPVQVAFLSTTTDRGGYRASDVPYARELAAGLDLPVPPLVVAGEYGPVDLVDMYAAADLHLGTRMHSDILAMSAGTPAVAIAYEDKTVGLMEMMDLRDLLLDIESLAAPELEAVLARAWDDRRALRARLAPKVADLRGRARRNLELMREAADRFDATRRA